MGEKKKKSVVGTALSLPFKIWKLIKLIILFVVLASLIIGYSGYKTIQGFRDDGIRQSEFLYVDTVNNTANFTMTVENQGFFPIYIEIEFKLEPGVATDIGGGGQAVIVFTQTEEFDIKGGDTVTKNITFGPMPKEVVDKIEDGAVVTYTPTTTAKYAWVVPITEQEFDPQEIVVFKQNFKPRVNEIKVTPEPVLTGSNATIMVNATDLEGDELTYSYTMNGNTLDVPSTASEFNWTAPDVPGTNILGVEIYDGRNTVKRTVEIEVQKPLFLTINSTVRHNDGEVDVWVNASKGLGSALPDVAYYKQGEAKTVLADLAAVGGSKDSFKGSFSFSDGTYFIEANATDPENGMLAEEYSELSIQNITTVDKKVQVTTTNVTIDITTEEDLADVSFSVEEVTENVVNETTADGEQLYALNKFIKIETEDVLKDNLSWALVRVDYDEDELPVRADENSIGLYFWNEVSKEWEKVDVEEINTDQNYFIANLTHFSIYGGFSSNRAPFVNAGDDQDGQVDKEMEFNVFIVDDPGDEVTNVSWDFDGDGIYDYSSNDSTKAAKHTFTEKGTYTVTVRVTDKGGANGYDTIFVTVEEERVGGLEGALAEMPGFELPSVVVAWAMLAFIARNKRKRTS